MEAMKTRSASSTQLTPLGFLERAATVYGDCASVVYNNSTFTWSQTNRRCLRLASSLSAIGVCRGDVVSVFAPNIPAMYELHFAVPMTGAVLNNINTRLNAETISVILRHGESKLVFVDQLSGSLILDALSLFPANIRRPLLVLIGDSDVASPDEVPLSAFHDTYVRMVERGDPEFKWIRPTSEWDPMILNYTSGTTSSPKGVVHSHRSIFSMTVDSLMVWPVPHNPVYLWTLPMFHANGWCYPWGMAAVGATNVCLRKFDAPLIFAMIKKHGVTHMCGAPVVLNMLTNNPTTEHLKNPVQVLTGGAPPPAIVLHRTESLGFVVNHTYGLTETAGPVMSCAWKPQWNNLPAAERARLKSRQGVGTGGLTEVDVVDSVTGKSVKRDGTALGEIVIRGSCVMLGYYKNTDETKKAIREDGWFYTGDVGVMHPDGYIEIKDRSKDVIISGGENVSSVEVESVLYTFPSVLEAAVVARPDANWGESPCAFVSLKEGLAVKPSEKEIIDYCREKLPKFMAPKTVVFKDDLPKTSTGKIQKFVLREMARKMGPLNISRL